MAAMAEGGGDDRGRDFCRCSWAWRSRNISTSAGSSPGIFSFFAEKTTLPLPDKPSIAVLPFENMTGDPKQEYFTDGFTEQIITSLSKISSLFVIARNSSFTYKGKPVKVRKVGRELGVRYVLEGSIQKSGDRVRINAQLIDAISEEHVWAEHYDRDMKDIFSLQDEIIFKILTALQVNLTHGEEARVWAKGTKNLEAYLNLIQAREILLQGNVAGNARARQLIEETIALDPKYALAYMYMGTTHLQDFLYNMMALNKTTKSPKESLAQAIEWMQKALAIDDTLAEAHARLGHLYLLSLRHEESIVEVDKAMAMDPNSAVVHYYACIISESPESRRKPSRCARRRSASSPSPPAFTTRTWEWPISRTAPIARKPSRLAKRGSN